MTLFNKSLGAFILAALTLPANAVNVTVHNQGHYLVSFEVNDRHSGNFGVGQSRTMENASGTIRINWLPYGFSWCSTTEMTTPKIGKRWALQVGKNDVEIFFQGDIFAPHLRLNGFDPINYSDDRADWSINLNDDYQIRDYVFCEWRKLHFP